ncbi:MAG TPA: hypothetical protein VFH51_15120 [Myxococcota bacterium]|nr:hypothetical protein [Myxococcota bacterium]
MKIRARPSPPISPESLIRQRQREPTLRELCKTDDVEGLAARLAKRPDAFVGDHRLLSITLDAGGWRCARMLLEAGLDPGRGRQAEKRFQEVQRAAVWYDDPDLHAIAVRLCAALVSEKDVAERAVALPKELTPVQRHAVALVAARGARYAKASRPVLLESYSAETVAELDALSNKIRAGAVPLTINIPMEVAKRLVESGVYKTLFETQTTRGNPDLERRQQSADRTFSHAYRGAEAAEHPRYGLVNTKVRGGHRQYGEMVLVVNSIEAGTMTAGDSLSKSQLGNRVAALKGEHEHVYAAMPRYDLEELLDVYARRRATDVGGFGREFPYLEGQFHSVIDLRQHHGKKLGLWRDDCIHPDISDAHALAAKYDIPLAWRGGLTRPTHERERTLELLNAHDWDAAAWSTRSGWTSADVFAFHGKGARASGPFTYASASAPLSGETELLEALGRHGRRVIGCSTEGDRVLFITKQPREEKPLALSYRSELTHDLEATLRQWQTEGWKACALGPVSGAGGRRIVALRQGADDAPATHRVIRANFGRQEDTREIERAASRIKNEAVVAALGEDRNGHTLIAIELP